MKVTNDEQSLILREIQMAWDKMNKNLQASFAVQEKLQHVYNAITRRINQFQSSRIIIISAGMLKAGKSTLVNLLARTNNASPVGYGYDTTLNPALVKMGARGDSEGAIYVYNLPSDESLQGDVSDDKKRQEALQMVWISKLFSVN